ncbi:MAG TPA: YceI family protein [Cyclobacteriaceae bacterium]
MDNRRLFFIVTLVALVQPMLAQRYMDRAGHASFYSKAPLEDIEAHTDQALCILDASSGEVAASMLMRSFQFEKALMQEHFNSKYVESDKYPKATFTGKITNLSDIDLTQNGTYTAKVEGEITIHGVTKPLTADVEFVVQDNTIRASGSFPLRVKDFKITIPTLVVRNIAEVIEVRVAFDLRASG